MRSFPPTPQQQNTRNHADERGEERTGGGNIVEGKASIVSILNQEDFVFQNGSVKERAGKRVAAVGAASVRINQRRDQSSTENVDNT